MINKKVYFIGLTISLVMVIARLYFIIDDLNVWTVTLQIIKTFFFIHLSGLIGFGLMKFQRIIFQSFFANLRIFFIWIALFFWVGFQL
jgi:hypothetical protein